MNDHVAETIDALDHATGLESRGDTVTFWIDDAEGQDIHALLAALATRREPQNEKEEALLGHVLARVAIRARSHREQGKVADEHPSLNVISSLYRRLGTRSRVRHHLLSMLAFSGGGDAIEVLGELIKDDPPADSTDAAVAFAALFQQTNAAVVGLYPDLLDGLKHLSVAAPILDLANYLAREEVVDEHPAAPRKEEIAALLGSLAQRLGHLEENPDDVESAGELSERVSESVALAVSLCDAVALIGDESAVGKLYQTLELRHRRLRTEAGAALARLGHDDGFDVLAEMAKEPVARLRALAYADELGQLDRIEDEFKTQVARAEAELVVWLAEPAQMGIPPTQCELFDSRTQYWPGYDDPMDCFLFRFTYSLGSRSYSNIGMAGPLTHTFIADLEDLPPEDIYAAFAGWQAEHEEIREVDFAATSEGQRLEAARLQRRMQDEGYIEIKPALFGYFFGEKVLVASARRDGIEGWAVADTNECFWRPAGSAVSRPLGAPDIYCIYKGQKLLRAFNP